MSEEVATEPTAEKTNEEQTPKSNDEVTRLTDLANRLLADNETMRKEMKSLKAANSKASKTQAKTETVSTSESDALKAKIAELEKASEAQTQALNNERMAYAREAKLAEILPRISKHRIMRHEVLPRIGCEIKDGKPETYVLDSEGNRVVMTWDKLIDEFKGNKEYADFVIQSEASGSDYKPDPKPAEKTPEGNNKVRRIRDMISEADKAAYYNKRAVELGIGK